MAVVALGRARGCSPDQVVMRNSKESAVQMVFQKVCSYATIGGEDPSSLLLRKNPTRFSCGYSEFSFSLPLCYQRQKAPLSLQQHLPITIFQPVTKH